MAMILSDRGIEEELARAPDFDIEPFHANRVQPSSYDVALSSKYWEMAVSEVPLDLAEPITNKEGRFSTFGRFRLNRGQFLLASTVERVKLPPYMAARIEGKSSLGRLGLVVHATAGYVDPGFKGHLTLELSNLGARPLILRKGMLIGQISFILLDQPARHPYGDPALFSKYQDQGEFPIPSEINRLRK